MPGFWRSPYQKTGVYQGYELDPQVWVYYYQLYPWLDRLAITKYSAKIAYIELAIFDQSENQNHAQCEPNIMDFST